MELPFGEKDDTANRAMDAHEDYQVNVFNAVMDQIVTSTSSRFSCLDPRRFDEFRRQRLPRNALGSLVKRCEKKEIVKRLQTCRPNSVKLAVCRLPPHITKAG